MRTLGIRAACVVALVLAGCGGTEETPDEGETPDSAVAQDVVVGIDNVTMDSATGPDAQGVDTPRADNVTPTDRVTPADRVGGDAAGGITLTSTALAPGATFMAQHTCYGTDVSPPLAWTAGPAGTMSYAIVFTDRTINFHHWILLDIPATTRSLSMAIPMGRMLTMPPELIGARQQSWRNSDRYAGPCSRTNNYEFTVYALPMTSLGITAPATGFQAWAGTTANTIRMNALASGSLGGTTIGL
jgi:phosphatidylethanolamine-binding protein (PEBP) family uncharacterized protein